MIIKTNQTVLKNYLGETKINKIYAGENLVFGQEEPKDYTPLYFGLTAIEDASIGLTGTKNVDLKYSSDGENWTQWDYTNETLNLPAGETLYFKGDNSTGFYQNYSTNTRFSLNTGKVSGHGNIQSLIYDDNFVNNNTIPCNYCFAHLFNTCTSLTTAPELPATTLANNCYYYMFVGCTLLTAAPELPATTLAPSCYSCMFGDEYGNNGCTSLTKAPELPATTLASNCYNSMFADCTSLTTAPELLATTLTEHCYENMFYGCTSLTTAPELPATTLALQCYNSMFNTCTSLTTAPELPATTLVSGCYRQIFDDCSNLKYIKAMFTTEPTSGYIQNWVRRVSSTGTFVMNAAAEWNPEEYRGTNGIPSGWTVETAEA